MHNEVIQAIASGKGSDLRYFFVDSLNIDPTFTSYQDDFDYCLKHNVFEQHRQLTPFRTNKAEWDKNYWLNIKADLQDNFSVDRMRHMIEIAKVIYRGKNNNSIINSIEPDLTEKMKLNNVVNQNDKVYRIERLKPEDDPEKKQEREIEKAREELRRKEERRNVQTRPDVSRQSPKITYQPKKAKGVPLVPIIAGAAVGLLLLLLMTRR